MPLISYKEVVSVDSLETPRPRDGHRFPRRRWRSRERILPFHSRPGLRGLDTLGAGGRARRSRGRESRGASARDRSAISTSRIHPLRTGASRASHLDRFRGPGPPVPTPIRPGWNGESHSPRGSAPGRTPGHFPSPRDATDPSSISRGDSYHGARLELRRYCYRSNRCSDSYDSGLEGACRGHRARTLHRRAPDPCSLAGHGFLSLSRQFLFSPPAHLRWPLARELRGRATTRPE
jgi:hypothetical protein